MQRKKDSKLRTLDNRSNPICDCALKPEHRKLEHDWCCQICGGSHTERICPQRKEIKKPSKVRAKQVVLAECENSSCPYYKSQHRRYQWYSKTKSEKPSCPKCFSHNTTTLKIVLVDNVQ